MTRRAPRTIARRHRLTATVAVVAALVLAACTSDGGSGPSSTTTATSTTTAPPKGAAYAEPGPYVAGVTTLTIGDRRVEVWYPADRGAEAGKPKDIYFLRTWLSAEVQSIIPPEINPPFETDAYRGIPASAKGPFPVVLFSHGVESYRNQSTFLTTHLAQWGFVVVAPDHLERGVRYVLGGGPAVPRTDDDVLEASIAAVRAASKDPQSVLAGTAEPGKIGIVGHSAGGAAAIAFAHDPEVATYVALAAGSGAAATELPDKPSLFMSGAIDGVVSPAAVAATFAVAATPTRLVSIDGVGHLNAFSDLCEIGTAGGGVIALARAAGLPIPDEIARLGTDGCQTGTLAPAAGHRVVDQYVTAQLLWGLGINKTPIGLSNDAELHADLAPAVFTYRQRLG